MNKTTVIVNINSDLKKASRGYNMYMGNLLKCKNYYELVNTVKSMMQWDGFQSGELDKLKKLALRVELGIQEKNLGSHTEASHVNGQLN